MQIEVSEFKGLFVQITTDENKNNYEYKIS